MKRWRRPLLLIALLLLAGAVVNVGVAWVLVGAPDSWTPGGPTTSQVYDGDPLLWDGPTLWWINERLAPPSGWPAPDGGAVVEGLGWTLIAASEGNPLSGTDADYWWMICVEGGFPARSLEARRSLRAPAQEWTHATSLPAPVRIVPNGWFSGNRDRLPLGPLASGFLFNTFVYAAILALPLSAFPIRRRLRARRGRCPKCGYDLAGLADPAAPCPECGAAR